MNNVDSIYFHFPFCAHLCNYCDFYKKVSQDKKIDYKNYQEFLLDGLEKHQSFLLKNGYTWSELKTVYLGGGTPSLWGQEGASFFTSFLQNLGTSLDSECEFTLEVNPATWTPEGIEAWIKAGVNRFSIGIQTLNSDLLPHLDRYHSIADVFETMSYFSSGKHNFSVDLMLGLPFSEKYQRNVLAEIEKLLEYHPSHFSVYILTVKENYKYFTQLPSEEWIESEYLKVADYLKSKGFLHYEVSNFSLSGKQSKHNLKYWKSESVAAFGPSATGFLNESRSRYKWKTNHADFEIEQLTENEFELEKIYMALRSDVGLSLDLFHGESQKILDHWVAKKWVIISNNQKVQLSSQGYLLLDTLMNDLFNNKLI